MSDTAVAEPSNDELSALIDEHFREFKEGSIVNGTILDIRPQVVVVDIGYKSEGAIPVSEFEVDGVLAVLGSVDMSFVAPCTLVMVNLNAKQLLNCFLHGM